MSTYSDYIYNYIKNILLVNYPLVKPYYANTRIDEPVKPYVLIRELANDENHRTSEVAGKLKEFRNVVVTIGVYFDSKVVTNLQLCKEVCGYLRKMLSSQNAVDYFSQYEMSNRWENISATRDLTESVSGGFTYRYEFDIPINYIDEMTTNTDISKGVDLKVDNEDSSIEFDLEYNG